MIYIYTYNAQMLISSNSYIDFSVDAATKLVYIINSDLDGKLALPFHV